MTHIYLYNVCALTDDGVLLYVSLALSCMPNAIFSPLGTRPQWWPVHYSTATDFQHRSSRRCQIQQDDRSAFSPSLNSCFVLRVLPDIHSRVSSFHTDCDGNPLQPTFTGNSHTLWTSLILAVCHEMCIFQPIPLAHVPLHNFLPMARSTLLRLTSSIAARDTSTASGLRLVSTMLEKTSFLSRSTLNSQSCLLSSTDFLLDALLLAEASTCSQTEFVLAPYLLVVSFSSPPPAHQLARTGLCHVAIYIYTESMLLIGALIECAPLSLSCHTACSLALRLDPTDAGLQEMGVCHTLTSAGTRS